MRRIDAGRIGLSGLAGLTGMALLALLAPARALAADGEALYRTHCASCHMVDGGGVPMMQPALIDSPRANGDKGAVVALILRGSAAVENSQFNNEMPAFKQLTDDEIAALATYVRTHFNNSGGAVGADLVRRQRGGG
ncbi:c-type cytochrome [Yunchengibacter salinarum]|uniref:c-type cytochrome n=1 Tax=Yunchengibacter salinarum TaxID=3133399 RepID=UPI0035B587DA